MNLSIFRTLAAGAIALAISACGGGADGGIGGTGGGGGGTAADVSVGAITAFGSVWVNGVEFNSDTATIKRDDDVIVSSPPLDRKGGLRRGMVARVDGSISSKSAATITVKSAVKGYVELVGTNQMTVMGQTIITDGATVYEDSLHPVQGNYIEVHGQFVSEGQIAANFIETKTTLATPPFAVKGLVKLHNAGGTTFDVGALHVILGNGAIVTDMPAGSWNGLLVEVKGTACASNPVCTTLTASKVEPEGVKGNVAKIEVEGFVTALTSTSDFTIGSQRIVTTGSTVFQGGLQTEIALGGKLEAEGSLSGGILTATKVSFRENIRFEALLAVKGSNSFMLTGLPSITIEVNALTKYKNVADFNALVATNYLRVRGRPGSGNNVIATEVEVQNGGNTSRVIMQAVASNVTRPNVTLLGITIDTTAMGTFRSIDDNAPPITADQFFAVAAAGKLIKARGGLSGGVITWNQEIQLED